MQWIIFSQHGVRRWLVTAATVLCVCAGAPSQQTVEKGATLHVYTNLLQIPVLILSQKHQAVPAIEPEKFLLRIGRDPAFRPRVRLEGEDPLTLAVLIDGSLDGPTLPALAEGLATMAHDQLHRQDRLALYGMDGCKLRRTSALRPPDAEAVRSAVQGLEAVPPYEHHWRGERCDHPTGLWDALSWVVQSLQGEPGRRVVLVVTNGADSGSRLGADEARLVATRNGVAVFAMAERYKVRQGSVSQPGVSIGSTISSVLGFIAEGSGGMVMETARNNVAGTLGRFPQLLRGRYILEFSRPAGMTAGAHFLVVSVGQPKDFIRPAGTSMPVADPEAADPSIEHGKLGEVHYPADEARDTAVKQEQEPDTVAPVSIDQPIALPPPARSVQTPAPVRPPAADPTDITNEVKAAPASPGNP